MLPLIVGLAGPSLNEGERAFLRTANPAGVILFGRNIAEPGQLRALTDDLRAVTRRDELPILVDQEGGRVARLGAPHWPVFPAAGRFDALYDVAPISAIAAAMANAEAMAIVLKGAGINLDCAPVLDVPQPGAHDVIGDRALGREPMRVAALGRAVLDGLAAGGVCGVVKHMPGHGRAESDSHFALPVVRADAAALERDLAPFQALREAPIAMSAHLLFTAWDDARPATLSPTVIAEVIRGAIGFDGLLLTDDITMAALEGPLPARAAAALTAGCDLVLHGSGDLAEAEAIAAVLPAIGERSQARLDKALASIAGKASAHSLEALLAKRDALLAYAG